MLMAWDFERLRELQAYIIQQLWLLVKQVGELLPDYYTPETIPDLGELDELETFVKSKKIKFGCGRQSTTFK
jgi:hypothetical protein